MASIGLALYTVRDDCERDLAQTLRDVAALGYQGVEFYSLYGNDPADVRRWLDELGLVASSRHTQLAVLEGDLRLLAGEVATLGTDRVAQSWIDPLSSLDEAKRWAERVVAIAGRVAEQGLRFGFHNHWTEPVPREGVSFLDLLLEQPAELLWLQLDLGWIWEAGADPATWLDKARGRSPVVHVKDFRDRGTATHCPVGDGEVGYDRVLPVAVEAGVEWLLVEQDETDGPALAAAERSLDYVRRVLE
jgi:sugar phosphate isomerase/epimerase